MDFSTSFNFQCLPAPPKMAKSANFHSPNPSMVLQTPTIPVQEMEEMEDLGAEQLQEKMIIATLDALEQVHVPPHGRPSEQQEGRVHIYFE